MPVKKIIKNKVNSNKQTRKTRCESCVHTDANDLRSNHFGDVFLYLFLVDYMTICDPFVTRFVFVCILTSKTNYQTPIVTKYILHLNLDMFGI